MPYWRYQRRTQRSHLKYIVPYAQRNFTIHRPLVDTTATINAFQYRRERYTVKSILDNFLEMAMHVKDDSAKYRNNIDRSA